MNICDWNSYLCWKLCLNHHKNSHRPSFHKHSSDQWSKRNETVRHSHQTRIKKWQATKISLECIKQLQCPQGQGEVPSAEFSLLPGTCANAAKSTSSLLTKKNVKSCQKLILFRILLDTILKRVLVTIVVNQATRESKNPLQADAI